MYGRNERINFFRIRPYDPRSEMFVDGDALGVHKFHLCWTSNPARISCFIADALSSEEKNDLSFLEGLDVMQSKELIVNEFNQGKLHNILLTSPISFLFCIMHVIYIFTLLFYFVFAVKATNINDRVPTLKGRLVQGTVNGFWLPPAKRKPDSNENRRAKSTNKNQHEGSSSAAVGRPWENIIRTLNGKVEKFFIQSERERPTNVEKENNFLKKLLLEERVTSSSLRNQMNFKLSLFDAVLDGKMNSLFEEGFHRGKRQFAFLNPDIPFDGMNIQKDVIGGALTSPPVLNDFLIED